MRNFLCISKNKERDAFVWNMIGSMLNAFQSVIFLMILTRTIGIVESGVFTIAYANANLFLNIGKYGMRNYQVSDVIPHFSFEQYKRSRYITCILMIVVSVVYTVYVKGKYDYSDKKSAIIIWMCLFKTIDAWEDVYYGLYQQQNRLDIAAKALSLRMIFSIVVFVISILLSKDLLLTLKIATISSFAFCAVLIHCSRSPFEGVINANKQQRGTLVMLLWNCLPLFLGAFLSFYIGNAPKYSIDAFLSDELQACYGFIAMPVFVIGVLNNFIFNPLLYRISLTWKNKEIKKFIHFIFFQVAVVGVITLVCIIGAGLIGIPVLSFMYNTDLSAYKTELLILLLGGGFLGLSGLLSTVITIIRFQKSTVIGYGIVAAIAFVMSDMMVEKYEMMGAAVMYTCLMALVCLLFGVFLSIGIVKKKNEV